MPQDRNEKLLEVGDIVNVPCIVTSIQSGTDYCNIGLQTQYPMYPGEYKSAITANSKQVVKVETEQKES